MLRLPSDRALTRPRIVAWKTDFKRTLRSIRSTDSPRRLASNWFGRYAPEKNNRQIIIRTSCTSFSPTRASKSFVFPCAEAAATRRARSATAGRRTAIAGIAPNDLPRSFPYILGLTATLVKQWAKRLPMAFALGAGEHIKLPPGNMELIKILEPFESK